MARRDNLHFKTNVQLKSIIGKDLINDDNIAVLELVKNSFDADAKKVQVKYLNLKTNDDDTTKTFSSTTSRVLIQDDGIGMDLNDIRDKWLNIAYSEKKTNKTQHKRRMAGAKGVGRFSCDRLGEFLNLYSKKSYEDHYYKLTIDWKKFEVQDDRKEIQSIPLEFEIISKDEFSDLGFKNFEHGVLLEIIKLRSNWVYPTIDKSGQIGNWDINKFVDLKKYLEKLINPNQAFESNDFGIYIDAPEFIWENSVLDTNSKFIGKVENKIFESLDFKTTSIESSISDEGDIIHTELKDKGETIFWIKEKNTYYPDIKNVKITVYYLSPYAKSFFTKQTGIRPVDYGSIFLFINGFRVPPYGEIGNDWLGLDQRKAQGYSRYIGLRELVGQIEILDEENDFQIVSSREGVVKNESFKSLTLSENNNSYFYKAFRRLERYVVEGLNWDSAPNHENLLEIHKKIVSGETKEEDLEYSEDQLTKQKRVYSTIHNIISAKPSEVIELYINENLITQKIEEEREASEREFNQLIEDFGNKKIDADTLNRILHKKALENAELDRQLKEFSKYTTNEATSKALIELQEYKRKIESQTALILDLKKQLEDLKNQKESVEKSASLLRQKIEKVEVDLSKEREKSKDLSDKLNIEVKKNQYLNATRKTLSDDAEQLIHSIDLYVGNASTYVNELLKSDLDIETKTTIYSIKNNIDKAIKISQIIIKSNFDYKHTNQRINITQYIKEYLEDIMYSRRNLNIEINNVFDRFKVINPIDIDIIFDNLISNSIKAKANKVSVEFNEISNNQVEILYSDNGTGVPDIFLKNSNSIFELGVRESNEKGSGIGMFDVKKRIENNKGNIEFIGNNVKLKGATFKITI